MRKNFLFAIFSFCFFDSYAQLVIANGASLIVQSGASIIAESNVTSNTDLIWPGKLVMKGAGLQNLSLNAHGISNLEIDNTNNVALQSAAGITNSLLFTNGRILTGSNDILAGTATISGQNASRFIWTNSTGRLVRTVNGSATIFPVGVGSYTPVTVGNTGTPDEFLVRVSPGVFSNGTTGTQVMEKAVDRTWHIEEVIAGGSVATISIEWNVSDQLPSFSDTGVFLWHFTNGQWDPGSAQTITYSNNIASISRMGINSFSPFVVGNVLAPGLNTVLNLKLILQGYYVPSTGFMEPVLANQGVGINSANTDNINVQLRDPSSPALIVASATGILHSDGTVSLTYDHFNTPKYIVVNHRNSIQTWSADPVAMGNIVNYDFTTAASRAFGSNMIEVSPGVWALFTGDLNQDGFVDGNDFPSFDTDSFSGVNSIYVATDMNGDGFVDGNDFPLFDSNSFMGVISVHP